MPPHFQCVAMSLHRAARQVRVRVCVWWVWGVCVVGVWPCRYTGQCAGPGLGGWSPEGCRFRVIREVQLQHVGGHMCDM